jgi:hypothetical protein
MPTRLFVGDPGIFRIDVDCGGPERATPRPKTHQAKGEPRSIVAPLRPIGFTLAPIVLATESVIDRIDYKLSENRFGNSSYFGYQADNVISPLNDGDGRWDLRAQKQKKT